MVEEGTDAVKEEVEDEDELEGLDPSTTSRSVVVAGSRRWRVRALERGTLADATSGA